MYPWSFFIILVVLGSHSEEIKLPQISLFESQEEKRKHCFLSGSRHFSLLTKYLTIKFYHLLTFFSIFLQGSYQLAVIIVSLAKVKRWLTQSHPFALATWMYNKGDCNKLFHGPLGPLNPQVANGGWRWRAALYRKTFLPLWSENTGHQFCCSGSEKDSSTPYISSWPFLFYWGGGGGRRESQNIPLSFVPSVFIQRVRVHIFPLRIFPDPLETDPQQP